MLDDLLRKLKAEFKPRIYKRHDAWWVYAKGKVFAGHSPSSAWAAYKSTIAERM
jgi:hypothetical protein